MGYNFALELTVAIWLECKYSEYWSGCYSSRMAVTEDYRFFAAQMKSMLIRYAL